MSRADRRACVALGVLSEQERRRTLGSQINLPANIRVMPDGSLVFHTNTTWTINVQNWTWTT